MSCEREMSGQLRSGGRRFTVQRLRVAAALRHAGGRQTAEEIHARVLRQEPHVPVPLSTVYRTLGTLKELRLVAEVDSGGGRAAYEWIDPAQRHLHLRCAECEGEQRLDASALERLAGEIRAATGFETYLDHFMMHGRCAGCGEAAAVEPEIGAR